MNTLPKILITLLSHQNDFVSLAFILKSSICKSYKKEDILLTLIKLKEEGKILITTDGYFILNDIEQTVSGKLQIDEQGYYFIIYEDTKYIIDKQNLNNAQVGDIVILSFEYSRNKKIEGTAKIEKIVQQHHNFIIIELVNNKDVLEPRIYPSLEPINIHIDQEILERCIGGDRLIIEPTNNIIDGKQQVIIKEFLGNKKDPTLEIQEILQRNNRGKKWSKEAMDQAYEIAKMNINDYRQGRIDYTKTRRVIFSLDGKKTQDRDDCISIEILENGNYLSTAYIADPTALIKLGTPLWKEALERGYSDYIEDYSDPMLPRILTDGVLSLNPEVLRLSFVSEIEVTPEGEIIENSYHEGIIRSRAALTFNKVNEYYDHGTIPEGYEPFIESLDFLRKLSKGLERRRNNLGGYSLSEVKPDVQRDEFGNVIGYDFSEKGSSENVLKNIMLLHGLAAAQFTLVAPFRCHFPPDETQLLYAIEDLVGSGIIEDPMIDYSTATNKDIKNLLSSIRNPKFKKIAEQRILRASPPAFMTVTGNIGHNALGEEIIAQFTSPDRRGGDFLLHYSIKMQINGKIRKETIKDFQKFIETYCRNLNTQEKNCKAVQRDGYKLDAIKYILEHFDEKFIATVEYISRSRIILRTQNNIQGTLYIKDIEGDTFTFDDERRIFISKKTRSRIKLGSEIIVTPLCTNPNDLTIEFQVEYEDILSLQKK